MSIVFDEKHQNFHLKTKGTSYVIHLIDHQYLQHIYWGKKIHEFNLDYLKRFFFMNMHRDENSKFSKDEFTLDVVPQEYPSYGSSDLRSPAVQVTQENGSTITELLYESHRILSGKPVLKGLPATYAVNDQDAETLEITLKDSVCGLKAILSYTVFEEFDVITRSVKLINDGSSQLKILRALSMNVDFLDSDYDLMQLSGSWGRERQIVKRHLAFGSQSIESRRGASSHQQNPFITLSRPAATEDTGDVFGLNLVYSGNFLANVEVDPNNCARVQMGINPFDFSWLLRPSESFQAPETVMVYSSEGYGKMSRTYHEFYRQRLCRGKFRDKERPILINNWEATYFDFNEESLVKIASEAKELGIEMFVLDDGWFGHRDDDTTSLGDWFVDKKKLPNGLGALAEKINGLGMKFGLWFEPEMISPNSDLYRAHPDWCIHVPDRKSSLGRHQLILDLSRPVVCDYIINSLKAVLNSANIEYVKWDMNRNMTEIGSATLDPVQQRETAHRYILGLYRVMDTITSAFPNILFESCAAGGGRFDAGILYYMPQTWTSDNTDAIERLRIQYGTSMAYPAVAMGSHVSAVPNHQLGRITPLQTRGNCAMGGNFGYELDVTKMTEDEKEIVKQQTAYYKSIRKTVQFGDQYRLVSPFESNNCAWMYVSKDQSEAVVSYFSKLCDISMVKKVLKLKGLDADAKYCISGTDEIYGGDELMNAGLVIPVLRGDFLSCSWKLEKVSD